MLCLLFYMFACTNSFRVSFSASFTHLLYSLFYVEIFMGSLGPREGGCDRVLLIFSNSFLRHCSSYSKNTLICSTFLVVKLASSSLSLPFLDTFDLFIDLFLLACPFRSGSEGCRGRFSTDSLLFFSLSSYLWALMGSPISNRWFSSASSR